MEKVLISVIMSTYNEELQWIKECVNSILNQSYKNFEFIIIIDNPYRKDIIDYLKECKKVDRRIILEVNKENLGLTKSLNKAIRLSKGKYIARMDADDISLINRFEKQLEYIQSKNLDLIGSNAILFNENGLIEKTNKLVNHKFIEMCIHRVAPGIIHPTFFGKKEVFKNCMYNESVPYAQDYEFMTHALALDYRLGNISKILLRMRYRRGSITSTKSYHSFLIAQNIKYYYSRFKKTGVYEYNNDRIKNIWHDKSKEKKFINKNAFLRIAKQAYNEGKYISFIKNLYRAILSSNTAIYSILDVVFLKFLKIKDVKSI